MRALRENGTDRAAALRQSFQQLAAALLHEVEPEDDWLGLFLIVITDAALSGDRTVLAAAAEAISRLQKYLPPNVHWREDWRGRLWALHQFLGLASFLLEEERRIDEEAR